MIIWSFRKCVHGRCPENWKIEKKLRAKWACPWNTSYGMHMKKICLTGLLLGMNDGCIITKPNQSVLQCNGNIPSNLQPKSLRLLIYHQREGYAYRILGFSGSIVSPFSEAWWKCEFCIVMWSSVQASGCNLQKTSWPTGKRSTASS
jgi:hypothetical protein